MFHMLWLCVESLDAILAQGPFLVQNFCPTLPHPDFQQSGTTVWGDPERYHFSVKADSEDLLTDK